MVTKQEGLWRREGCNEKWILYDGDDQFSGWTEKKLQSTSQSQTCIKKRVMVTGWWSATDLIHYSFLNTGKTITSEKCAQQIDERYGKLQLLPLALINRKGPVLIDNTWPNIAQSVLQKLNKLGCESLPHLPFSPNISLISIPCGLPGSWLT